MAGPLSTVWVKSVGDGNGRVSKRLAFRTKKKDVVAHAPEHSRTPRHGVGPAGPSRPSCELLPGHSGGGPGEGQEPDRGWSRRRAKNPRAEPGRASAGSQPPRCLQQEEMWPGIKDTPMAAQTVGADAPSPLPTRCRDPRPGPRWRAHAGTPQQGHTRLMSEQMWGRGGTLYPQ